MMIHLITLLFHQGFDFNYGTSYSIGVYGSIVLLLVIPGIIIRTIGQSKADIKEIE